MDSIITSPFHDHLSLGSWVEFILGLLIMMGGIYAGLDAFLRGYRKSLPKEEMPQSITLSSSEDWDDLCMRANSVVEEVISQLAPELIAEAKQVPYLFQERAEKESPGYRLMGSYHNFIPGQKTDYKGPIFLYLKSIEEWCAEENKGFEAEVRTTYLHELGHHFGWDEIDLVRHGLPSGRPPSK